MGAEFLDRVRNAVNDVLDLWPDVCPTGEHRWGFCCQADDHDFPVDCKCRQQPTDQQVVEAYAAAEVAEVKRVGTLLAKFANHNFPCDKCYMGSINMQQHGKCTCGLDAALAAWRKLEAK